jgi:hypothetical protein
MSDNDIFNDETQPTTVDTVIEPPKPPVLPDHLKELVGEGKKYASVEKALESIPHAQTHIQKLESELREIREKLAGAKATEEVYEAVEALLSQGPKTAAPVLDESAIDSVLDRKLTEREQRLQAQRNVESVKNALKEKFGDKAQEMYRKKAEELGVGVEFLNDVVRKSPRAAEELFGLKAGSAPKTAPTTPGLNTEAFKINQSPQDKPKPVMGGSTTEDMVAAWRAAKPVIKE